MKFEAEWPELMSVEHISKISEIRNNWRMGIKEVEMMFNDHINKVSDQFSAKADEYERLRQMLIAQLEYLKRWYLDMQRKLDEKKALIAEERK